MSIGVCIILGLVIGVVYGCTVILGSRMLGERIHWYIGFTGALALCWVLLTYSGGPLGTSTSLLYVYGAIVVSMIVTAELVAKIS